MSQNPPVIFIILDGVRKDRLSLYDHERQTSPNLDAFAEDALVFKNAYTPGPWSLPAHTSMLTGLHPSEHGMTNVFSNESLIIPDSVDTVPDVLSADGYRTGGFSNNPWLGQTSGIDERFDMFLEWDLYLSAIPDNWDPTTWERRHSKIHKLLGKASGQPFALLKDGFFVSRALESADRWVSDGQPSSFTFVNLMGAHTPYYPTRSAFKQIGVDSPSLFELRRLNMRILRDSMQGKGIATTHSERVREVYDTSIRAQDKELGEFLDSLKHNDFYDESLIIIAADHGKTLGEFDRNETPTHYLRDVNINVPLVIKPPQHTESTMVEAPFELSNIFRLLKSGDYSADWLQAHTNQYALIEDFVPHTGDEREEVTRWRAVTDGSQKYIVSESGDEFFTTGTGPAESLVNDVGKADEMRELLEDRVSQLDDDISTVDPDSGQIDGDIESQLKELGYLN